MALQLMLAASLRKYVPGYNGETGHPMADRIRLDHPRSRPLACDSRRGSEADNGRRGGRAMGHDPFRRRAGRPVSSIGGGSSPFGELVSELSRPFHPLEGVFCGEKFADKIPDDRIDHGSPKGKPTFSNATASAATTRFCSAMHQFVAANCSRIFFPTPVTARIRQARLSARFHKCGGVLAAEGISTPAANELPSLGGRAGEGVSQRPILTLP